jgi:hypothetical protein
MFSRNRPDRDDRSSFGRRVNRMDFCAGAVFMIAFALVAKPVFGSTSLVSAFGVCLGLAMGRLRDIGRISPWVAFTPAVFPVAILFLRRSPLALGIDVSLMALTTLILVCYAAATPGDPARNRFGSPPVGFLNAFLAARARRRSVRS